MTKSKIDNTLRGWADIIMSDHTNTQLSEAPECINLQDALKAVSEFCDGTQPFVGERFKKQLRNTIRAIPRSRAAVAAPQRNLYSELVHIAAELVRADGFLSPCEEDLEPRLRRISNVLKTARVQDEHLKDWAMRIRRVADQLSTSVVAEVFGNPGISSATRAKLKAVCAGTSSPVSPSLKVEEAAAGEQGLKMREAGSAKGGCLDPDDPAVRRAIDGVPLCPVHKSLDERDDLVLEIGNNCVACSLHERAELLTILEPFANPDGSQDSVTVLRNAIAATTPVPPSDAVRKAAEEIAKWVNWRGNIHQAAHEQNIATLTTILTRYFPVVTVEEQIRNEFRAAAIEAHVWYRHVSRWDECDYAKCAERREMIASLRAATVVVGEGDEDGLGPVGDGRYCRHHDDDPAHGAICYDKTLYG